MIRNNKFRPRPKQSIQQTDLISYRNALYQGQYNKQQEKRQGRGIIYQSNTHHFIACNKFIANKICDQALFYHSHSRYHYGRWQDNCPHGICIFRLGQILIITQYKHGKLVPGKDVLFILEKYCMGIVIEIEQNDNWSIRSKYQVFCNEQMENIMNECNFSDSQTISPSLIKFLNNQLATNASNSFKLRLINNKYYRYGFDRGLAIFFDDEFRILSAGFHNKNDLSEDVGIKYNSKELGGIIEEGIFDGSNTFVYQKNQKPQSKLQQMYSRHHLSSINFKNQFILNPSQPYFHFFETMMGQKMFKEMINQLIINSSLQNDSIRFFEPKKDENMPQKYQKLQFENIQIPNFKKNYKQLSRHEKIKSVFGEQSSIRLFDVKFNDKDNEQNSEFQKLSEKNRLEIMKMELHDSLSVRQFPAKLSTDRSNRQILIQDLTKSNKIIKEQSKKSQRLSEDNLSENKSQRSRKANLQQKIDIVIRQSPSRENTQEKSKTKRKIFQPSKSIKRGYSPETQVSPFKSRMKARIFDISRQQSKSRSRSKSNKKIFTKLQRSPFSKSSLKIKPNDEYLSPHLQMGLSIQKSNGSSQIANFPVTMAKESKISHNPKESEGIQDEGSMNINSIKQNKTSLKENIKMKEDQLSQHKRGNQIYRNPMINGGYTKYVYEPINVKQAGNSPYIKNSSLKSISRNKSNSQLVQNPNNSIISNKKMIGQTSPLKRVKMGVYLNTEDDFRPNTKYADYKKRTGYF